MKKTTRVSVAAFIYHQGKALIVRRSKKENFLPGVYEMPGGKLDFGEEPMVGVVREVGEEVGLKIVAIAPYHIFSYTTKNDTLYTVEVDFLCKLKGQPGKVILSDAHDKFLWISKRGLEKIEITPLMKDAISRGFDIVPHYKDLLRD
jgi:8-oxo-dGTP diphosphatase